MNNKLVRIAKDTNLFLKKFFKNKKMINEVTKKKIKNITSKKNDK